MAFKADIVAARICKQCDLPIPPRFRRSGHRYTDNFPSKRSGWHKPDVLIERFRVAGRGSWGLTIDWFILLNRERLVSLRLRTTTHGIVASLYYGGRRRRLALVDGELLPAEAEAIRQRFETCRIAARLGVIATA